MRRMIFSMVTVLAGSLVLGGCGPSGRVKTSDEPDLVGSRTGGGEVYKPLTRETTEELLDQVKAAMNATDQRMKIAFTGLQNKGAEELGDVRASTYEIITQTLFNSAVFRIIDLDYVERIMRETGQRPDDLYLRDGREKFLGKARQDGKAPDFLLWGTYTTLTTKGEGEHQRDYLLTLKVVDAETGDLVARTTAMVRKEYKK